MLSIKLNGSENESRVFQSAKKKRKDIKGSRSWDAKASNSNLSELSTFVLALMQRPCDEAHACGTPVVKPMLYLCDNYELLKFD